MPPSKRFHVEDDESDDDELFAKEVQSMKNRSSRQSAEAKKARKDERLKKLLSSALKSGERKLEAETRLDEIHQRNSIVKSPPTLERTNSDANLDCKDDVSTILFRQLAVSNSRSLMDIGATMCLGTRSTLNLERCDFGTKKYDGNPSMMCAWSTIEAAVQDFRGVLLWEQEKARQKGKTSQSLSASICEELLQKVTSNQRFVSCLQRNWLCERKPQEIGLLPVSLLRWLYAMACSPIAVVMLDKRGDVGSIPLQSSLVFAKLGAYTTLSGLWSRGHGHPTGRRYFLNLQALSEHLREWFGSTFPTKDHNPTVSELKEQQGSIHVSISSIETLTHFLHLWALAIQHGLVRLFQSKRSSKSFESQLENVRSAILALLWISLDPVFGSSGSNRNDCRECIESIVSRLLENVQHFVSEDIYTAWVKSVASEVFRMWSSHLGGGSPETDARIDKKSWLPLARTVRSLRGTASASVCKDLQFELARLTILNGYSDTENTIGYNENKDNWLAAAVTKSLQNWGVLTGSGCGQRSWSVLATANAGLAKLARNFPDNEPTICYSLVECSVCCVALAMLDFGRVTGVRNDGLKDGEAKQTNENDDDFTINAFCWALDEMFESADRISSLSRNRIMQNKCFPLASSVVECLKSYIRLLKGQLLSVKTLEKKQKTMDSYFQKE